MKVYLVNDTSAFHCGSWAVTDYLKRTIEAGGHTLRLERDKLAVEEDALAEADLVLVNGEGTLHDDSQRSIRILSLLGRAQAEGRGTAICNASWWNMTGEFDAVLRRLDYFGVREAASAELLRSRHGVQPHLHLDLSFFHTVPHTQPQRSRRIACTDFYSPEFQCFVRPTGGPLARFDAIDMRQVDWQDMLEQVAGTECLATGRHHATYAACRTRTPFVALPGNIPKIEGLIAWSGIAIPMARVPADLQGLLAGYRRHLRAYADLFDWMQGQPPWTLPF